MFSATPRTAAHKARVRLAGALSVGAAAAGAVFLIENRVTMAITVLVLLKGGEALLRRLGPDAPPQG